MYEVISLIKDLKIFNIFLELKLWENLNSEKINKILKTYNKNIIRKVYKSE